MKTALARWSWGSGLVLSLWLAGCGSPAVPEGMGLSPADGLQLRNWVPGALKAQVQVGPVFGGQMTGRMWGSKVSDAALRVALEESLKSAGMLAIQAGAGRYELRAKLAQLEQPMVALMDAKVVVTVDYEFVELASGKTLYQRQLRSVYVAEFGQAVLDQNERLRLANEGALRKSINTALRELLELRL